MMTEHDYKTQHKVVLLHNELIHVYIVKRLCNKPLPVTSGHESWKQLTTQSLMKPTFL